MFWKIQGAVRPTSAGVSKTSNMPHKALGNSLGLCADFFRISLTSYEPWSKLLIYSLVAIRTLYDPYRIPS